MHGANSQGASPAYIFAQRMIWLRILLAPNESVVTKHDPQSHRNKMSERFEKQQTFSTRV